MTSYAPYADQMAVVLKNGLKFFVPKDKATAIALQLSEESRERRTFIVLGEDVMVSVSEIVGIFAPKILMDEQERRRGSWMCPKTGAWHGKDSPCDCLKAFVLPELGRTLEGPAGVMMSKEELDAVNRFDDPELAAVGLRKGHSDFEDWAEMRRTMAAENVALTPPEKQG